MKCSQNKKWRFIVNSYTGTMEDKIRKYWQDNENLKLEMQKYFWMLKENKLWPKVCKIAVEEGMFSSYDSATMYHKTLFNINPQFTRFDGFENAIKLRDMWVQVLIQGGLIK